MAPPERVLIGTSAFYAIISVTDRFHRRANDILERATDGGREFWTTLYVLVESTALIHRRLGFHVLSEFIDSIESNLKLNVFWVDAPLYQEAWNRMEANQGRGLSFVDWTIALVSNQLGAQVFAFDRGFSAQGILVLSD